MNSGIRLGTLGGVLLLATLFLGGVDSLRAEDDAETLRKLLEQQSARIQEQAKALEEQNRRLQEQAQMLEQQKQQMERINDLLNRVPNVTEGKSEDDALKKAIEATLEERDKKAKEKKEREDRERAEKEKAAAAEPVEVGKDRSMKVDWDEGQLTFRSADRAFKAHLGGFFQFDAGWFAVPESVQQQLRSPGLHQGSALRRMRLRSDGTCWEVVEWVLEMDFSRSSDLRKNSSSSDPDPNIYFNNVYVGLRDLPYLGTLRIGHQKEALGFYSATSGRHIPFMERPYIWDAYEDPYFFDNGITLSRTYCDDFLYTWLGLFQSNTRTGAFAISQTAQLAFDARVCVMPVYNEAEQHWINIGVAGSVRANPYDSETLLPTAQTTVAPLVRTGSAFQVPNLINTNDFYVQDGTQIFTVTYNQAWGPLTLGAQYEAQYFPNAFANGLPNAAGALPSGVRPLGNLYFDGCFFEVLCFLTRGDHHRINKTNPSYARVVPVESFYLFHDPCTGNCGRGLGAWEVGVRYDFVRAQFDGFSEEKDGKVQPERKGGHLHSLTLGLNWYLNANAKMMLNYGYTTGFFGTTERRNGDFHALGARCQFDF